MAIIIDVMHKDIAQTLDSSLNLHRCCNDTSDSHRKSQGVASILMGNFRQYFRKKCIFHLQN